MIGSPAEWGCRWLVVMDFAMGDGDDGLLGSTTQRFWRPRERYNAKPFFTPSSAYGLFHDTSVNRKKRF